MTKGNTRDLYMHSSALGFIYDTHSYLRIYLRVHAYTCICHARLCVCYQRCVNVPVTCLEFDVQPALRYVHYCGES